MRNRYSISPAKLREGVATIMFFVLFIPMFVVLLLFASDGQAILTSHRDTSNVVSGSARAGVVELVDGTAQIDPAAAEDAVRRFIAEAEDNGSLIVGLDGIDVDVIDAVTIEVRLTYTNEDLLLLPVIADIFDTDAPIVQSTITRRAFVCIPGVSTTPGASCQRPTIN